MSEVIAVAFGFPGLLVLLIVPRTNHEQSAWDVMSLTISLSILSYSSLTLNQLLFLFYLPICKMGIFTEYHFKLVWGIKGHT
jgi:hypothetical protein